MSSDTEELELDDDVVSPESTHSGFSYFDHSHDQELFTDEYYKKQNDQLKRITKSWYKEYRNGMVKGYVMDFKQRNISTQNPDRTYSTETGLQLCVKTLDPEPQKLQFFLPFDPFFYIVVRREHVKSVLADLKISNSTPCDPIRDGCDLKAQSALQIEKTQGIKRVEVLRRHVFSKKKGNFKIHQIAIRVYLRSTFDMAKYTDYFNKKFQSIFTYDYHTHIQYGLFEVYSKYQLQSDFVHQAGLYLKIRVGKVYSFNIQDGKVRKNSAGKLDYVAHPEIKKLPPIKRFVFDIECQKKPMLDVQPDDPINVMGVKCGNTGYLFNNRELTHFDFPNFIIGVDNKKKVQVGFNEWRSPLRQFTEEETKEKWRYTPLRIEVIECQNERELLTKLLDFIDKQEPDAMYGFNSDQFDLRHIENRCKAYGMTIETLFDVEIISKRMWDSNVKVMCYKRDGVIMGDAMDWVIRDAYLSKGNQGLKGAASALLKILAMEENHEEIVQMWITMQKKLLNPQHPENQNPDQFEKNRQLAYEQAFEFARYNMSDVFITDIFVSNTIINLNLALASLIPMTVFHVSRRPRGEQCELKLMERMIDWGIIGDKISDQLTTELTPTAIQERGQTSRIIYKKDIEGQKESLEATCKSKAEMKEHCKGCTDRKCQDKWEKIWNLPVEKQDRVRCNRDSPEDEPYDEITFFPLNADTFPIKDEGFQGAKVGIYNRGFYTKNQAVKFKVTKSKLLEMKDKFRIALEKQIAGLEKKEFTYQGKKVKYQIKDKAGLTQEILGKFDQIIAEGKATDIDDVIIWEGCPMLIHVDVASMYPSIIINWNLQPYGIVDPEEDCATCPHRYDESKGEPCCWVEHEWYPKYTVIHMSSALKQKADRQIKNIEQTKNFALPLQAKLELYENTIKEFKGKKRKTLEYVVPKTSRVCQKAFKFFVYAVKSFREERLFYKALEKKSNNEIEIIKAKYKNAEIPSDIQNKIDELENQAIFARNMQLALKVLLNSVHEDEQVLIQSPNQTTKYWKCKDFWEFLTQYYSIDHIDHRNGIRCPEYNVWNGTRFVPIRGMIQHPFTEKLYQLRTSSGRQVRVTAGHSLTTVDHDFNIIKKKGSEFVAGTPVIVPTHAPQLPEISELNIGQQLLSNAPKEELQNVLLRFDQVLDQTQLTTLQRGLVFASKNDSIMASYIDGDIRANTKCLMLLNRIGALELTSGNQSNYRVYKKTQRFDHIHQFILQFITHSYYSKQQKKRYIPILHLYQSDFTYLSYFGTNIEIGTEYGNYISNILPISDKLSAWSGFFMAEGSSRKVTHNTGDSYSLSYSNNNAEYMNYIDAISTELFSSTITKSTRDDNVSISTINTKIATLVVWYVIGIGFKSRDKMLPSFIFQTSEANKKAFLQWYWNGDGSCVWNKENHVSFRTNSEYIVNGIIMLLNQLGYTNTTIGHEQNSDMFTIRINGINPIFDIIEQRSKRGFDSVINTDLLHDIPELQSILNNHTVLIEKIIPLLENATSVAGQNLYKLLCDGIRFDTVTTLQEVESSKYVYDFSTESEEELFVAGLGGIQNHNTYYGYLAGDGARFRSYDVTGLTTAWGKEIIKFGTDLIDPIAINLELDTDGLHTALPRILPLTTGYTYAMIDVETQQPLTDNDQNIIYFDAKEKEYFNLFNTMYNYEVEQQFINPNNYVPCASDGEIYNYNGEIWNPKADQTKRENQPIDYEHDPEYYDDWINDPHWKAVPQNYIMFEYDGGNEGFYGMFLKGKKMYQIWQEDDDGVPEVEETKGIVTKRKDGLNLMKTSCQEMFEKMITASSVDSAWQTAITNVINKYYQQIQEHKLPLKLIAQIKDLTRSEISVRDAYRQHQNALQEFNINPDEMHVHSQFITNKYGVSPKYSQLYGTYCNKNGILDMIKSPYLMTGFRALDLGLSITTVQWIILKYPCMEKINSRTKAKDIVRSDVSERVIPLQLLDGQPDVIRKYIYRWTGYQMKDDETIMDLVDWEEYLSAYEMFIKSYLVKTSESQVNVFDWLLMKEPPKKTQPINNQNALSNFIKKASESKSALIEKSCSFHPMQIEDQKYIIPTSYRKEYTLMLDFSPQDILNAITFAFDMHQIQKLNPHQNGGQTYRPPKKQILNNIFGKLGEIGFSLLLKRMYNIDLPVDFRIYDRGTWDSGDFEWENQKYAIKTTSSKGNALFLETHHWDIQGKYIPDVNINKNGIYDYFVLTRISPNIDDPQFHALADNPTLEDLKNTLMQIAWGWDCAGWISRSELLTIITQKHIIPANALLNGVIKMEVDNYYVLAGDMHQVTEFDSIMMKEPDPSPPTTPPIQQTLPVVSAPNTKPVPKKSAHPLDAFFSMKKTKGGK